MEMGPRPSFTVDFGDVLHGRLLDVSKSLEITKSQLVREAVSYFLDNECYNLRSSKTLREEKNQVKTTKREEVIRIVDSYNNLFYGNSNPPKQFYPALYKVYNAAIKGGLTTTDMIELIQVAPDETFVMQELRSGKTPSLPYLLSQGMIPRLMVVLRDSEKKQEKLSDNDFIEYKYDIIDEYFERVSKEERDAFLDDLQVAKNMDEVNKVVKSYA